jgi:hypothetical protein
LDFALRILDFGLKKGLSIPIPNPQSPVRELVRTIFFLRIGNSSGNALASDVD